MMDKRRRYMNDVRELSQAHVYLGNLFVIFREERCTNNCQQLAASRARSLVQISGKLAVQRQARGGRMALRSGGWRPSIMGVGDRFVSVAVIMQINTAGNLFKYRNERSSRRRRRSRSCNLRFEPRECVGVRSFYGIWSRFVHFTLRLLPETAVEIFWGVIRFFILCCPIFALSSQVETANINYSKTNPYTNK